MKTVLATTYAVNPYKGSEDGMGWNFIMQIARFHKVVAITRENNRPTIEKYMTEFPNDLYTNITFLYFDLPYWMRFWKKGSRGAMLYYWMWQKGIVSFIKNQKIDYDIVHNVNFHNDWTPSYLWKLEKPFVWGPVGHHPLIPKQYLAPYKWHYYAKDRLTWLVKNYFWKWSPSLKNTISKADAIWCMNNSVPKVLDIEQKKDKFYIVPSVATQDYGWKECYDGEKFTFITAGRLVPLKGFDLTILAFATFLKTLPSAIRDKTELIIVGSGPERDLYKKMVKDENIVEHVQFIDWIKRDDLMTIFRNAAAFVFPSHEGAGMVVPEALSFGLPVICLDNCGPGQFIDETCGFAIPMVSYNETVVKISKAIANIFSDQNLHAKMRNGARNKFLSTFHWDRRGEFLQSLYKTLN